MEIKFQCLHSGKCCIKVYTQISLTGGDIVRLSKHQNMSIKELFDQGYIGLKPFFIDENVFETEIGLTIPCKFRKDKRCIVYQTRPLNCRLFPYWLITEVPKERLKDFVDESYECIHRINLSEATRKKYDQYKKRIVRILEEEAELTDDILKKHNLIRKINISTHQDYQQLIKQTENLKRSLSEVEFEKQKDELKIGFAIQIIQESIRQDIGKIIEEEIYSNNLINKVASIEKIKEIENLKN
ncbi:YkgJ family cysteine cluster protein [Candidatus Woesearchaeota archaeon]|nr:YkgJ family cysteine cluster protein [Candidatus Woesearchaeota archaeon]